MKCLRCGAELPDDAKFCSECQAPTRSVPEVEEAPKAEDKGTDAAEIERRREQRRPGRRTPKPKPKSRKQRGPQSPQTGQHSPQASSPRLRQPLLRPDPTRSPTRNL